MKHFFQQPCNNETQGGTPMNFKNIAGSAVTWMKNHATIAMVAVFATLGGFIGGSINIAGAIADDNVTTEPVAPTASETATPAENGELPEFEADEVPDWVPTSGENLPIRIKPEANGETSWGPARKNPTGGKGGLDITFDGTTLNIHFTGNCGPNGVYISSLGNAKLHVAGDANGEWQTSSLCLPSSRTDRISMPITQWNFASCWRDTMAIITVTGTPDHDGTYRVPISGGQGPCVGEIDQWDWENNRLKHPQPVVTPQPLPAPSPKT